MNDNIKDNSIKLYDTVVYKGKERKIICNDYIEDLYGLEPINEPEDIVWVRKENCIKAVLLKNNN